MAGPQQPTPEEGHATGMDNHPERHFRVGEETRRQGAYVSRVTTKYPSLTRLANEWFRANRSDACPGWTSITVNVNLEAAKHRDTNNAASALVSLGEFKGGDLFVWRNDDRNSH